MEQNESEVPWAILEEKRLENTLNSSIYIYFLIQNRLLNSRIPGRESEQRLHPYLKGRTNQVWRKQLELPCWLRDTPFLLGADMSGPQSKCISDVDHTRPAQEALQKSPCWWSTLGLDFTSLLSVFLRWSCFPGGGHTLASCISQFNKDNKHAVAPAPESNCLSGFWRATC